MILKEKHIKGYILLASVMIMLCASMISVAAFRNIASEELRINYKIAKTKALYNAHTGIAESGHPYLVKTNFIGDTLLSGSSIIYNGQRSSRLYMGEYSPTEISYTERGDRLATSEGVSYIQTAKGDTVPVTASAQISTRPESFSKYMYFTNSERAGGAPFTFGGPATGGQTPGVNTRRPVTFGSGDILEGIVQCNEDPIVISQYGMPNFSDATLYLTYDEYNQTVGNGMPVTFNTGNWNQLFGYGEVDTISQPQLVYPPDLEELRENAHITIDAGRLRESTNGGTIISRDILIMTDIEFSPSAITITEYSYLMPPHLNDAALGNFFALYSPAIKDLDGVTIDAGGDLCYDLNHDGTLNVFSECGLEESDLCSGEDGLGISDCKPYIDALYYYHGKGYDLDTFLNNMPDEWYDNDPEEEEYISNTVRGPHGINQHFDVVDSNIGELIANTRGIRYLEEVRQTQYSPGTYVIYVKDGPVRVKGTYRGQYTIVTDEYTTYERHADRRVQAGGAPIDTVWNNIWLTGDLINYDALGQGDGVHQHGNLSDFQQSDDCEDDLGSDNVMGLVTGANVIVANTLDNSNNIIINAAIMASNESFTVHYWQNDLGSQITNSISVSPAGRTVFGSTNSPPWGDGRGDAPFTTNSNDDRGEIYLWGSVVQKYRGYTVRNSPSPYRAGFDAHTIGMVKDYHYDQNLKCNSPPFYPSVEPQGAEEVTSTITGFRNLD